MPVAKKPAAKSAAVKKEEVAAHKHDDLLKEIADLKKELASVKAEAASLKGQCHSCCGDLESLKVELKVLSSQKESSGKDSRLDALVKLLSESADIKIKRALRKFSL